MIRSRLLVALGLAWLAAAPAWGQPADAPGPVGGAPATLPDLRMPSAEALRAPMPRTVKAAAALAGLGRQRLALVLGLGTVGSRRVVEPATRDARAVAAALRAGGFVVMLREDVGAADLRSALAEFRGRLQPGGVGFIYVGALGAQLGGVNLVLPRDATLPGAPAAGDVAALLRQHGVPLTEVVAALAVDAGAGGATTSPRLLVVDAAWRHPALATLPQAGLAEQPLPPGVMALFGHGLNKVRDVPAAAPLPEPPPADPAEIAATLFARVLVSALATPRISGPQALLDTRRAIFDATQGRENLWLGGETDTDEELAEATLLEALIPRTPEEVAREALKQAGDQMMRPAAAPGGKRGVTEVSSASGASGASAAPSGAQPQAGDGDGKAQTAQDAAQAAAPELPSAGSVGRAVGNAVGTAADLAGTVVGIAATAAAVATVAQAAQAAPTAVAAGVAGAAVQAAGAAAGTALALMSGGAGSAAAAAAAPAAAATATAATAAAAAPSTAAGAAMPAAPPSAGPAGAMTAPGSAAGLATPGPMVSPATALPSAPTLAAAAAPGAPAAGLAAVPALAAAAQAAADTRPSRATASPPEARTVRSAEGGERPAYVPRRNAFGYAEGDTFTYQIVDKARDEVTGSFTTAIEQVLAEGQLVANGQQLLLDAQGRIKSQRHADGGFSEFEPAQDLWWSHPKPGEQRDVRFTETFQRGTEARGQTEWQGASRVAAPRSIKTPAGEFEVLPIESSGSYLETLADGRQTTGRWSRTVYHSTQLGHPVAIDVQDLNRAGRLLRRERVELMHAQTSRDLP